MRVCQQGEKILTAPKHDRPASISAIIPESSFLAEASAALPSVFPPIFHIFPFWRKDQRARRLIFRHFPKIFLFGGNFPAGVPPKWKHLDFWRNLRSLLSEGFRQKGKNRKYGGKHGSAPPVFETMAPKSME